jgi:predicted transcriptional regulator
LDRLKNTVAGLHVEKTSLLNFTATVDKEQKRCGRLQQEKATLQEKVEKFDEERRSLRKEVEDMVQTLKEKHQVELRTHEEVVERLKTDLAVQVEGAKVKEKINDNLQVFKCLIH